MSDITLFHPTKLKISKQRQLTIPKSILNILGVKPGESVVISQLEEGQIVIQRTQDKVDELYGFLKPFARTGSLGLDDESLDKAIEDSKKKAFQKIKF
jgi:AbrB family looped-hinge helix DNA binding protein